ncbi:MAG: ATP-dependent zinc metalloprotease FtsH, partial [Acidimicrobiia bacterium]
MKANGGFRRFLRIGYLFAGVFLLVSLFIGGSDSESSPADVSLDELRGFITADQVVDATIRQDADVVEGTLAAGALPDGVVTFRTNYPDGFEGDLTDLLLQSRATTTTETAGTSLLAIILGLLPLLLIFGVVAFLFISIRKGSGGVLNLRKSKARLFDEDQPKVSFGDVAGLDEAVEDLREIKDFLQAPDHFREMGASVPRGVLLAGPPGTGKTLLARAVAGEAGVPFYSVSGSAFVEMFVGVGASRVRDLFAQAKATGPAIVFIDEIDAVGRHRGAGLGGGNDEREQTLNQLLVEMDGFDGTSGVIVVAATNRPDVLDPALLRPGRFDRQILVDYPDLAGRTSILKVHANGKSLSPEVDLEVVARRTPGFTGADLANLLNEATLLATRRGIATVGNDELEDAVDKLVAGPQRRSKLLSKDEQRVIAFHEAGHALVGWALPCADPIHKVTIVPRGRALGYTQALPTEDRYVMHRSQLWNQIAMLTGGRASEELVFDDPSTGASNDLEVATKIARQMVTEYGMSERLGLARLGESGEIFLGRDFNRTQDYSETTSATIDEEIRSLLTIAQAEARKILATHR